MRWTTQSRRRWLNLSKRALWHFNSPQPHPSLFSSAVVWKMAAHVPHGAPWYWKKQIRLCSQRIIVVCFSLSCDFLKDRCKVAFISHNSELSQDRVVATYEDLSKTFKDKWIILSHLREGMIVEESTDTPKALEGRLGSEMSHWNNSLLWKVLTYAWESRKSQTSQRLNACSEKTWEGP